MERWQWLVDIFTFIGMAVCILIALIAIVWLTCFLVKLLVKTFGVKVGKSYDLMVEDINKKAEAKKERNEIKRQAKLAQKMEILNMKLENKQKIHDMKKVKLEGKLDAKENAARFKLFGENAPEIKTEPKKETKSPKQEPKAESKKPEEKAQEEESEEVFEKIAEVAEIVDGEVQTIEAVKPEEEKEESKRTNKKK